MKNAKRLSLVLLIVFSSWQCWSQASIERWVIGTTGGSYTGGTWLVDYTAGETVITTVSNTGNTLTQGFQQPASILVSVNEHPETDWEVNLYPNPSSDFLNISISNIEEDKTVVELYDIIGQRLEYREFNTGGNQRLDCTFEMGQYATGTYFLRVSAGKELSEVYKIVKINQ
jgi:hypothetical protein